jgi:peptidoglycan L-alanyl-D-glutamate endopeptidase CwlK
MDIISQQRLQLVNPVLAAKVGQLIVTLAAEGILVRVTQGLRTFQVQDALYAQGRKPLAEVNALRLPAGLPPLSAGDNQGQVTNAIGGKSYHNYGMAVDLAPGVGGRLPWTPNWDIHHPDYARMIAAGEALGLYPGFRFSRPDYPHFQLTGNQPIGAPSASAQAALRATGIASVWQLAGLSQEIQPGPHLADWKPDTNQG